jgi:DNA polymerase-3 subunit alpha
MDQMVFKIQSIELLSEILSDRTKEIKLRLELNQLNPGLLDLLQETLERNKGEKKLTIEVYDDQEKIGMDFLSRKMQVSINKGLISELRELENVGFRLIS